MSRECNWTPAWLADGGLTFSKGEQRAVAGVFLRVVRHLHATGPGMTLQ